MQQKIVARWDCNKIDVQLEPWHEFPGDWTRDSKFVPSHYLSQGLPGSSKAFQGEARQGNEPTQQAHYLSRLRRDFVGAESIGPRAND